MSCNLSLVHLYVNWIWSFKFWDRDVDVTDDGVWCWVLSRVLMTDWYSICASRSNGIHQVSARASSGLVLSIFAGSSVFFSSPAACKDNFHLSALYVYNVLVWLKHVCGYVLVTISICCCLVFSCCGHMEQDSAVCVLCNNVGNTRKNVIIEIVIYLCLAMFSYFWLIVVVFAPCQLCIYL